MNYKNLMKILLLIGLLAISISSINAGFFDGGSSDALKGSGEYKVGQDIPAGEYYIVGNGGNLYVEVASDSTGELDSIISNLNTDGNTYVTVKEGEYLKVTGGDIYNLDKAPFAKEENGYYTDGMYKVGQDIQAGEYNLESDDGMGYVEVTSDSRHTLDSITTNDNFESNKIITVSDGQYITLSHCKLKA